MNELANIIGAQPNIKKLIFTDPILAYRLYFGPLSSMQFRLNGPDKWPKAREAIINGHNNYSHLFIFIGIIGFLVCLFIQFIFYFY